LAWIFGALSPIGDLERCPTYKDAVQQLEGKATPNYALLGYPILQCSDIALYKGQLVPVGEDQVAHLEICREILRRFNRMYAEVFPEPQPKLAEVPRLMGLDGQKKMSKSLGNTIDLSEEPGEAKRRVLTMFTDPLRIKRSDPGRPEVCNVYTMHGLYNAAKLQQVHRECTTAQRGCVDCKGELAEHLLEWLKPIRERRQELMARPKELDEILAAGNSRARAVAQETMREVREAMFSKKGPTLP
jgi:tryptophanyl-tRNA synthetase